MARHIPGSLLAPLNKAFSEVVGSLVADETAPIVLVVREEDLEEAVRDLVRIGYDNVVGYVEPVNLAKHFLGGGSFASIEVIDFQEVESVRGLDGVRPLDVRYASEFDEGRVPGSLNLSYTRLPENERRIPKDGTLLVYCQTGARAAPAAAYLKRRGYDVRFVDDFIDRYAETGRPTAR